MTLFSLVGRSFSRGANILLLSVFGGEKYVCVCAGFQKNGSGKTSVLEITLKHEKNCHTDTYVHGGIALTSPPCRKKTDQLSNKKSPVYDQTIGKIVVVKSA